MAVTGTNSAGSSIATSPQTATVTSTAPPLNTSPPTVTGTPSQGQTLSAQPGTWTGVQPITYTYRWRRCDTGGANCADIAGAAAQTYVLAAGDVGSTIRIAVTATNADGSSSAPSASTAVVTVAPSSTGYRGPSFTGAGAAPTGSKPESKLWWNDGSWWASMWDTGSASFRIFRLNWAAQTWANTGVALDDRAETRADTLWDGTHLYVASHKFSFCECSASSPGNPSRLYRFSYNAAADTYQLDPGFPVSINNTKTETLVIDKDSTGTLWATWAQDNKIYVNHTLGNDATWGTPFVLPASGATGLTGDDISSLVSFGANKVGVLWSNQNTSTMNFASHVDGAPDSTWQTTQFAYSGPGSADDHISLRSLQTDGSGRIFAAVKTSFGDGSGSSTSPQLVLLVRDPAAGWSSHIYGRVSDDHTRAIVMLDDQNMRVHVFATAPTAGGTIYHKSAPISAISFPTGRGTVFIRDPSVANMNNATSTKQNVNSATGLVVVASNESASGYYWHNYVPLGP